MEQLFLYQRWLAGALDAFAASREPPALKGRPILLSPRQYAAALMQAYFGPNPLAWIAGIMDLPVQTLQAWRREPGFLLVMDWSKAQFAEFFHETLLVQDFSAGRYFEIAGEAALLEDSLRVRLRIQLYEIFHSLGEKLSSRQRHGLALETYDLTLFRRLFLFFLALEHYWPSPAGRRLKEHSIPLARNVVWPALNLPAWPEDTWAGGLERLSLPNLREALEAGLKEALAGLRCLH
jgi:hypothetical protein